MIFWSVVIERANNVVGLDGFCSYPEVSVGGHRNRRQSARKGLPVFWRCKKKETSIRSLINKTLARRGVSPLCLCEVSGQDGAHEHMYKHYCSIRVPAQVQKVDKRSAPSKVSSFVSAAVHLCANQVGWCGCRGDRRAKKSARCATHSYNNSQ